MASIGPYLPSATKASPIAVMAGSGDLEEQVRVDAEHEDEHEQRHPGDPLGRGHVAMSSSANSSLGSPKAVRWYSQSR